MTASANALRVIAQADIDRIVPALAPIGEDFPAEWALWKDRERIRSELASLTAPLRNGESAEAGAVPAAVRIVSPITEDMHVAAVKVLHRASGVDGLPQRMLDAMIAAQPQEPTR